MGKRGPRPTPSAIKKARGTYQPSRAAPNEFAPTPGIPVCPKYLDKTARLEWQRVVPELAEKGVLAKVDGAVLEGFCANYSAAVKLQRIADKKPIVATLYGPKENPAGAAARKAWALCRQFGAELGLSPSARTRVSMPEKPEKENTSEDFLFGLKAVPGGKA